MAQIFHFMGFLRPQPRARQGTGTQGRSTLAVPHWLCSALALCSPSPSLGLPQHPADKGMAGPEVLEVLQSFVT